MTTLVWSGATQWRMFVIRFVAEASAGQKKTKIHPIKIMKHFKECYSRISSPDIFLRSALCISSERQFQHRS